MSEAGFSGARSGNGEAQGLVRGVSIILLTGVALGVAYNGWELRAGRGLTWIAEDRVAELDSLPTVGAAEESAYYTENNDPLAVAGSSARAAGLPPIPAVGRPVKIELAALKQYFDAGAALFVDAREVGEFEESHIPGAVSLPYDEAATDPIRLESLDSGGRPVVTYCGGGSCELSIKLADELHWAGHDRVAVYMGGFPEWVEAGYPVESGRGRGGP